MLKIKVLVDNNTFIDRYFTGEPGFCLWLEEGGKKILFDTGYSGAFIQNANLMGIDLLKVDDVVLSHGHYDHTWGMTHLISLRASRNAKNFKPQNIGINTDTVIIEAPVTYDVYLERRYGILAKVEDEIKPWFKKFIGEAFG